MSECAKIGYKDRFAAELALTKTRRQRKWNLGKWTDESRIYFHRSCGRWHLTSQPLRTPTNERTVTSEPTRSS